MNPFEARVKELLHRSLNPVPTELNELDWKSSLSEKSDRIAQHLSAFANQSQGGFLIFGINNDGILVGLSKSEGDEIVHKLGNIARNNLAQPTALEHFWLEIKGLSILAVFIPEGADKPVYPRSGTVYDAYKRSAGQTVKMTQFEVKQLIAKTHGMCYEEQIAITDLSIDDVLNKLDYDSYFQLLKKNLPDGKSAIIDVLVNEEIIVKEKYGLSITNLGGILFARKFEDFKTLRRKAVRIIIYKGNNRIEALKEQESTKGYAADFEGLVKYIMDQLPTNEVIESAIRKQVKVYPEKAIREFVANALIHQNFAITGAGVLVEIFSDRVEITNPGAPLVDTNRFIDTAPKSRNECLASLLRRLNICEERGSGIDRAIDAIEAYQLPAPKFIKGEDYTRIILLAPMLLSKMDSDDRIRACYQHCCLHYINNQIVNNQSIRKRFNIPKNNHPIASRIIAETVEIGLIKSANPESQSKKFANYIPFWA
jgi:predicted HTH transcriptional regulator